MKKKGLDAGENKVDQSKSKRIRTTDDLELIKLILEANPPLKTRVLYFLEKYLGKR